MNFSHRPRGWRDRLLGWVLVAGLHVGLGWALLRGTGLVPAPEKPLSVEVNLIEAPRPPPVPSPPPPPPPPAPRPPPPPPVVPARPRPPAPVPVPMPMPAVAPQPAVAPAPLAPEPAPPAPVPAPAPAPAAALSPAPAATVNIGLVCQTLVKPVMPKRALREGLGGVVHARITLRAGKVTQIEITQSRPAGIFDAAVRTAVQQYRCDTPGDTDVVAVQVFEFKLDGE